jgi:hypothetical protein
MAEPPFGPDVAWGGLDLGSDATGSTLGSGRPTKPASVGHPGFAESLIPVWGSGREAVADYQEGDYVGAALNGVLAASDMSLAGDAAKAIGKSGIHAIKCLSENMLSPRNRL